MIVPIKIKRLASNIQLPAYAHAGDSGMDIFNPKQFVLAPGDRVLIPCGFTVDIPDGFELQVRSKSGLSRDGITVTNSPGTIDSNYKDLEVGVIIQNWGTTIRQFEEGYKIAQLVVAAVPKCRWELVDEIDTTTTTRVGGYGSSGD